jgi:GTP1/Obg family GTP-binding protein
MNKLDTLIETSCNALKNKNQLTYQQYQKCKNVINGTPSESLSLESSPLYELMNEVPEKESLYDRYKKEVDSLLKNKNGKNYSTKLNNIKEAISEAINTYENDMKSSESKELYKDMIMKHKTMAEKLDTIHKQSNKLLTIKQKNNSIHSLIEADLIYLKSYIVILLISLASIYYIQTFYK